MQRTLLVGMGLVLVGGVVTPAMPVRVDPASAAVTGAAMPFDFDGDGFADLAVGVPGEDLRGVKGAGAAQVLYGSAAGVTARDQVWHQGRKGIKNKLEKNDHFGQALLRAAQLMRTRWQSHPSGPSPVAGDRVGTSSAKVPHFGTPLLSRGGLQRS